MNDAKKGFQSDDEEDLEALRLAALQTLKKTPSDNVSSQSPVRNLPYRAPNKPRGNYTNKRGRFYGGRGLKNGQFHGGRTISSNLIPLTPSPLEINSSKPSEEIKLHLPQDNYLNKSTEESKPNEISTKFDRYKDKSEDEDTEDELLRSDSDDDVSPSSAKLERSDSLEALMQELTDEIQGKSTTTQQPKTKVKTKRKKEAPVVKLKEETIVQKVEEETKQKVEEEIQTVQKVEEKTVQEVVEPKKEPQLKNHKKFQPQNTYQRYRNNFQQQPFVPQFPPTYAPEIAYTPYVPPFRPLSPLHISAETLQTQTMAPLSPRSAAFVLENRAIVEKRKRSPRRSPSFSPRRSLTPIRRRSLSPRKRSLTPKRKSPSPLPRKRSRSPKRRAFSPKRRPTSPKRRSASPRRRAAKSKPSIRERLGVKSSTKIEDNEPKKPDCSSSVEKDAKPLDPVLEARKKKFENKEIKVREGVIRLKPKEEARSVATETKIVEEPLDEDELDINTDLDIFFDEDESASEIEVKKEDKVLVNGVKEKPKLPEPAKKKLGVKLDRNLRKFDRKIEIKIKNPSKYQQADKEKEKSKKVEVSLPQSYEDEEDDDTEIIVEDDKDENNMSNEGDLRAQLSKKRAEKRQKHTRKEVMTSRLLQNALQNVLPVKKKSKKSSKLSSTDIDSGKMPIRLRLGLAHTLDTSKPKSKSKKRKLSEIDSEDQVFVVF